MGKWLDKDGLIDLKTRIKTKVDTKVDKYTEESAGKFLQTDDNGNAVWGTAASPSAVAEATEQWLDDHVSGGSTIAVDDSLTVEGAAADAKATGALVKSAATQPTDSTNRLWINESSETEYQVPTYSEFSDLKSAIEDTETATLATYDQATIETPTPSAGGINGEVGNQITTTSSNSYRRFYIGVTENDIFNVYLFQSNSSTYPYYIYLTDDNDIIYERIAGAPSVSGYHAFNVYIPENVTRLHIMWKTYGSFIAEVIKYLYNAGEDSKEALAELAVAQVDISDIKKAVNSKEDAIPYGETITYQYADLEVYAHNKVITKNNLNDNQNCNVLRLRNRAIKSISFTATADINDYSGAYIIVRKGSTSENLFQGSVMTPGTTYTLDENSIITNNDGGNLYINYISITGKVYPSEITVKYYTFDEYRKKISKIDTAQILTQNYVKKPIVFNGKTATYIGDSITKGTITAIPEIVHTTENYPKLFSEKVGIDTYQNLAVDGATLTTGLNNNNDIYHQIINNGRKSYQVLFVAAGVNDYLMGGNIEDLKTSLETICDYIIANYTSCENVIFITPMNEAGFTPIHPPQTTINEIRKAITETVIAKDDGRFSVIQGSAFNFPDETADSDFIDLIFGDKLHPSELGYRTVYLTGLLTNLL